MFQHQAPPPMKGWMLAILCAVYLLTGIIGHDPWKSDDAIHLGIAWEFARDGDWLHPRIGIEPLAGITPLYHWLAALLGKTLAFVMPFHDGARLATVLFGALMLIGMRYTAKQLTQRTEAAPLAPLLAIGTLGLLMPIHDAQPAIAVLAAQAGAYASIALIRSRPWSGASILAVSIGSALWSGGISALLPVLPPVVFAFLHREWRTPGQLLSTACGFVVGIGIGALWPLLLLTQAPGTLNAWWAGNLAHLTSFDGTPYHLKDHFQLLAWFTWPTLPIALWSLWLKRGTLSEPTVALPLTGCLFSFAAFFFASDPTPLESLHLIIPLALLALPGAERLRRGASNAFDWFGIMTFTLLAGLAWLGGVAIATGQPARIAKNFYKSEPGFIGELSIVAFIIAALTTAAWLWTLLALTRSPWRSAVRWATGVTLTWTLVATLWLPWVDYGKTYRPVAVSLKNKLGNNRECIVAKDVGFAQKASFRYFVDIVTEPLDKRDDCPWLLIQGASGKEPELNGMKKAWEGSRGGDKSERLRLYRRTS